MPIRQGGGVHEWIWKGSTRIPLATIEATVVNQLKLTPPTPLRYRLKFGELSGGFVVHEEVIEDEFSSAKGEDPESYYLHRHGKSNISFKVKGSSEQYEMEDPNVKRDQSILSQRVEPQFYPELGYLGLIFEQIRFYRDLSLGQDSPLRIPQQTDLPRKYLLEDGSNLSVILKGLLNERSSKDWIFEHLQDFYPSFQDIRYESVGNREQLFFQEDGLTANVSTARLSDGTLRFLCLLAVLCSARRNPILLLVICIEEPEMGLHPDVIPKLARLLVEASDHCQIIVTTHSDILVDALSETPEAVVICEKVDGATQLRRLDKDELKSGWKNIALANSGRADTSEEISIERQGLCGRWRQQ